MKTNFKTKIFILLILCFLIFFPQLKSVIKGDKYVKSKQLNANASQSKDFSDKIPVLLYHHIMEPNHIEEMGLTQNGSIISDVQFKKEMKFLHDNGYYTATLDELRDFIKGKIELPSKTVVITFDDGYLSNAVYAYPVLKEYNFNATIFMVGANLFEESQEYDYKKSQHINIKNFKKYSDVFSYESHTYDLHKLDNEKGKLITLPKEDVLNDLMKNKQLINAKYLAYPYGHYNNETINMLKETNHEMAFTVSPGYVNKDTNIYEAPRFIIFPNTSFQEFKEIVSGSKK
ncbi:putative xylanase/chitin deacetylase [Gottschalkia purinilytica]|uniref:Putative xylanase/chitin deacetylase n=1 Tax=Gottschalkia purinilytica TaxID=1503 RepID=A0A0L0WE01_GOTPU|nr:polysaccharide deacetylase family protein [Gottschalkia purinilytica]KNF09707.1 putative xylanase/chitin deacetylase [Gottschalkia purinilytica]